MADNDNDDLDDGVDVQETGDGRVMLGATDAKNLRKAAKKGRRAEELERENVLLKAGLDADDPKVAHWARGYEGEWTKDAIIASAKEFGLVNEAPAAPAPSEEAALKSLAGLEDLSAEEITSLHQAAIDDISGVQGAASLAGTAPADNSTPNPHPFEKAKHIYDTELGNGAPQVDAGALAFNSVVADAMAGDQRVIISQRGGGEG